MMLNEKVKNYLFLFAKIAIAVVAFYFIFQKISIQPWDRIENIFTRIDILSLVLIFPIMLLSILNWLFEAYKWQVLSTLIKPTSYKESLEIVFSSFAVSTITPNRVGEYGAKILHYNNSDWKKVLSYNFLGNMMQLLVTLLVAIIGYFFVPVELLDMIPFIGFVSILLISIILIAFLFTSRINFSIPWISDNIKLSIWSNISIATKLKVLGASGVKYLSFSIQLMLMLIIFSEADIIYIFPLVTLYYIVVSVIPTVFISDLLIKGSVSIILFSFIGIDEITMIAVVLLAWIFNFVIPTIIGLYYLFNKKEV